MKEKLVEYIEWCLKACAFDPDRVWLSQASGAVQFVIRISDEGDFEELHAMWEEYRKKFIEMIWGGLNKMEKKKIDRRMFKKEGEELQQYLHFRKRGSIQQNKKGKGSYNRQKQKHVEW